MNLFDFPQLTSRSFCVLLNHVWAEKLISSHTHPQLFNSLHWLKSARTVWWNFNSKESVISCVLSTLTPMSSSLYLPCEEIVISFDLFGPFHLYIFVGTFFWDTLYLLLDLLYWVWTLEWPIHLTFSHNIIPFLDLIFGFKTCLTFLLHLFSWPQLAQTNFRWWHLTRPLKCPKIFSKNGYFPNRPKTQPHVEQFCKIMTIGLVWFPDWLFVRSKRIWKLTET